MATLYLTDGTEQEVSPVNGRDFKLGELYKLIKCEMVEVVYIGDQILVFDEEGKLHMPPKPVNEKATAIFHTLPHLPGDYIAGNALLCSIKEMK